MKLLIKNGKVVGTATDTYVGTEINIKAPDTFDITKIEKYTYANGILTLTNPVPASVTRRQARQALLLGGYLSAVQPAIDAIADATQRQMIQIEWEDSQTFERNRPSLIALGTAIGLNSAQLDALFITAAQLG